MAVNNNGTISKSGTATSSVKKQPRSMSDYANQIMTQRAEGTKNQYDKLNADLAKATPKYQGRSDGTSSWNNFNPAVKSGKDPLTQEQRDKYKVYESYIGKAPVLYDPMRWGEAESIARFRTDPFYEQQLDQTLKEQNKAAAKTGFYGQLPAEKLKQQAIAHEEANRQQQIYDTAMNLMQADDNSKYMQYGLKYQGYRDMMGDLMNSLGYITDAFDTDWDKNYRSWQESFNQWYQQQQLAIQQQQLAMQQAAAAAAARGGRYGGGSSSGNASAYTPSGRTYGASGTSIAGRDVIGEAQRKNANAKQPSWTDWMHKGSSSSSKERDR